MRRKVCAILCLLAIVAAAGIFYYYWSASETPEEIQGGTLVYERNIVYSDREKC